MAVTPSGIIYPGESDSSDVAYWFAQMAGTDAKAAFQGMCKLVQAPKQSVKLLEQKIAPAPKPDTEGRSIEQWIQDLGSAPLPSAIKRAHSCKSSARPRNRRCGKRCLGPAMSNRNAVSRSCWDASPRAS